MQYFTHVICNDLFANVMQHSMQYIPPPKIFYQFFFYNFAKKNKKQNKWNTVLLFSCSLHCISLSVNLWSTMHELNKICPTHSDWKTTSVVIESLQESGTVQLSSQVVPVKHMICFFFKVLLRLMYDVSIKQLSQNRTKPLSSDSSDQHVLSIWTLPAPHGLSFQFHSTAANAAKLGPFFPLKLLWKSWWSLLGSLFCFVLHGLFADCLVNGDNPINSQL